MTYSHQRLRALRNNPLIDAARLPTLALRVTEIDYKQRLFKLEDAAATDALRLYRQAFADLRTVALDAPIDRLDNSPASRQWRDAFLDYATRRLSALTDAVAASALRRATAAYLGGYYGKLWQMDVCTKADVRVVMPPVQVETVIGNLADLREDVYDDTIRRLLGKEWRQQYATELDDLVLRIRRQLGNGMVDGDSIDDLMRRVRDEMGIVTDRRRGTAGSAQRAGYRANFNRVQAITRTVVNQASNNGAISAYEANDDVLSGYTWLAANDERTCPQCSALDGTEYTFGDTTRPPAHVNCRCTVVANIRKTFLVPPDEPPRQSLDAWATGYGIDREIAVFLRPTA